MTEKRQPFPQTVLEQISIHTQKNEPRHRPYTLHKNKLKWIIDLNVKCKTINLLEENRGEIQGTFGMTMAF